MNQLTLTLIQVLHIFYISFVVITPFTENTQLLILHSFVIPFMMLHWGLNDNTCALTILEKSARKQLYGSVDEKDCFTCRLINPVYDFHKNYEQFNKFIYSLTIGLWLITVYKLYQKKQSGEIQSWKDLFVPRISKK